jgi:hypothetical protein
MAWNKRGGGRCDPESLPRKSHGASVCPDKRALRLKVDLAAPAAQLAGAFAPETFAGYRTPLKAGQAADDNFPARTART